MTPFNLNYFYHSDTDMLYFLAPRAEEAEFDDDETDEEEKD